MSARMERLEKQSAEVERKLDRIDSEMAKAIDLAEIKDRVSQLPTIWEWAGWMIAIFGAAFVLLRFGLPR